MTISANLALSLPSALALAGYGVATLRREAPALGAALLLGWLAHGAAIAADLLGLGSPEPGARFGFAPALSVTIWLVLGVYGVESRLFPLIGMRRAMAGLGLAAVALAWLYPGTTSVLVVSPWEPVHWVLGFASYGLFGAAVLHAAWWRLADRRLRMAHGGHSARTEAGASHWLVGLPLLKLETLTFGFVATGFVTLSGALLLGWVFASPWRWTHKTVFSLLAWAVFALLLLGRHSFGWRGRVATRWLYSGSGLLLLAYAGSRFVLEVLLHRRPGGL